MSDKDFVKKYLEDFSSLAKPSEKIVEKIISVRDILINAKKNWTSMYSSKRHTGS